MAESTAPVWVQFAEAQGGVVTRRQLLAAGMSRGQLGALLDSRRWSGLLPGVYATFNGPVPACSTAWAAVLYAGHGAALDGPAALWLWGVTDLPPDVVTICVPAGRRVRPQPGVRVGARANLAAAIHPAARPPRLRVEHAVLEVTAGATDPGRVIDLVLRATRGRYTTPARLRAALADAPRHRWRRLLEELLGEAEDGVQSGLERRWLLDVERRHGLPRGERNTPEMGASGSGRPGTSPGRRSRYRDVRYRQWRIVVELDGREAHPEWAAFRDRERDNAVTASGEVALRYGWRETVTDPCGIAAQLVTVLRRQGWSEPAQVCGPGCAVREV